MKKILALILAVLTCISMVACAAEEKQPAKEGAQEGTVVDTPAKEEQEEEKKDKAVAYTLGETISLDFVTLTLEAFEKAPDGYQFSHEEGYVTYNSSIEAPSGMDLLCFKGRMTSLAPKSIYPGNKPIYGVLKINNFEYEMKLDFYNVAADRSMHELVGGMEARVFFYAEVPEGIAAQAQNCEVSFGFVEKMDPSKFVRDIEDLDYVYKMTASVA